MKNTTTTSTISLSLIKNTTLYPLSLSGDYEHDDDETILTRGMRGIDRFQPACGRTTRLRGVKHG